MTVLLSLGDTGTWRAFPGSSISGNFSGTFNSTSNPLLIAPTIFVELGRDASPNLAGTATIMNSPCISSLTLSGQAIGDAFSLTDVASKARIIAVPTGNGSLTFKYNFGPTAPSCAGDVGRGMVRNKGHRCLRPDTEMQLTRTDPRRKSQILKKFMGRHSARRTPRPVFGYPKACPPPGSPASRVCGPAGECDGGSVCGFRFPISLTAFPFPGSSGD